VPERVSAFENSRVVVKIGGEVIGSPDELAALAGDLARLAAAGARVAVVHGGGAQATELQRRLGIEVRQVAGRRITDAATLDVMKMVVAGKLNVDLCAALVAAGARPVGLHGASSLAVRAEKRPPRVVTGGGPDPIDFGLVGDVTGFDTRLIELLQSDGYVPVVACLGADAAGQVYNINADVVANQLAAALAAEHLFLVTGAPGVLRDVKDPSTRLPLLTVAEARRAIADGVVTGGMIPKLEEAIGVLDTGVGAIHILGKLAAGDLVRAAETPGSVGTTLVRQRPRNKETS
jgi:acetylglutamate kinase